MKINKTKCFHWIYFYSDALSQTSTHRYRAIEKSQHLKPYVLHFARISTGYLPITEFTYSSKKLCGRLLQVLNRFLSSLSSLYGWWSCLALLFYLVPYMFNKVMYGYWILIRTVCLAIVRLDVRFLSQRWVYLSVAILWTYHCTIFWSSRQAIYTSGFIEFPDKSYNRFVVSVEITSLTIVLWSLLKSRTTFNKFKLYS
jgi:hypothetical protein